MKCPNCGAEIPDNLLYCEKCGNEIIIISDIDLELDMGEDEAELSNEKPVKKTSEKKVSPKKDNSKPSKAKKNKYDDMEFDEDDNPNLLSLIFKRGSKIGWLFYVVIIIVIAFVVLVAVNMGKRITQQSSLEYQVQMAQQAAEDNNYSNAISYLEKAAKLDTKNSLHRFKIAEYYELLGNIDDAEYTLTEIGENPDYNDAERIQAYTRLFAIMKEQGDYSGISDLLEKCELKEVKDTYSSYLVSVPEFNKEAGTYTETIMLSLSTASNCSIYYTLDGSNPITDGTLYTGPINLEYGGYTVKAVTINDYDIPSEVVTNKYLIDVSFSFSAEVQPESGDYDTAFFVEVEVPQMYTCYYTTDGEDPDKSSKKYTAKIPVGEGSSIFKFIVYASDGTASEIVEREYNVTLNTEISAAAAVTSLNQTLIDMGYLDASGCHREGIEGTYLFMYSTIYHIDEMGDFYLVVEYVQDSYGNNKKTGNIYAINCYNGVLYTVNTQGENGYELTPLIQ